MIHVVLLLACAVVIYLACEWFVNAVEWLGVRLRVGPLAVGTILAAAGTALPESVVTLIAVLFGGGHAGDDIGVGAALGGPLVVGTIAYAITGLMLLIVKMPDLGGTDLTRLARDQTWFLAIFVFKIGLGLVAFALKPWLGLLFFVAYAIYFRKETADTGDAGIVDDLEPLKLQPRRESPATLAVIVQSLATLVVIFLASQLFVRQLAWAGPAMGLSPVVVALLLSPIATELPEVMNAVIWVRQGKTPLALANISGAMMIQATVPSGIGLLGTAWRFDTPLILAGTATMLSVVYLLILFRTGRVTPRLLCVAVVFYLLFAAGLIAAG
ncbi:membrane protein [Actinoplanes sp. SE50]|uniref:sodium:calcium antiporter n=1 Tax=unclassified Actinoplanes TaxID=2626549 RepID=UPI00023EC294|nr:MULTISPECIES: membrane protein [unclassified Actinoplanes]AEV84113.1 Vacuolar cation/proton exchanger 2 [Actinoplanes sp. SE50/110]ATO82505.1 membrane protein [Actinoplanes sp. SE50]SLL99912.1 membrane protein [Actinoplanes sp. SE50/110]